MKPAEVNLSSHDIVGTRLNPEDLERMLEIRQTTHTVNMALQPTLLSIFYAGFLLATLTVTRRNIRKYSSAVYLYVLLTYDLLLVCSMYLPVTITVTNGSIQLTDTLCTFVETLRLFSRSGALLITIILPLERILVLTNPKRFQFIATPKTAILVCGISALVGLALSGVNMKDFVWVPTLRHCMHMDDLKKKGQKSISTTFTFAMVSILLVVEVVNNVWLGLLLIRKRLARKLDPIQNSINAARQHTNQLNRINLIVFLMCLLSIFSNLSQNLGLMMYWSGVFDRRSPIFNMLWFEGSRLFGLCVLAVKPYVIGAASVKIRKELWLALKCAKENTALRSRGIEINPEKLRQKETAAAIATAGWASEPVKADNGVVSSDSEASVECTEFGGDVQEHDITPNHQL